MRIRTRDYTVIKTQKGNKFFFHQTSFCENAPLWLPPMQHSYKNTMCLELGPFFGSVKQKKIRPQNNLLNDITGYE